MAQYDISTKYLLLEHPKALKEEIVQESTFFQHHLERATKRLEAQTERLTQEARKQGLEQGLEQGIEQERREYHQTYLGSPQNKISRRYRQCFNTRDSECK